MREKNVELRCEIGVFAAEMERRLRANEHKFHWSQYSTGHLAARLVEEVGELLHEVFLPPLSVTENNADDYGRNIIKEAADVANFAMMIADKATGIKGGVATDDGD